MTGRMRDGGTYGGAAGCRVAWRMEALHRRLRFGFAQPEVVEADAERDADDLLLQQLEYRQEGEDGMHRFSQDRMRSVNGTFFLPRIRSRSDCFSVEMVYGYCTTLCCGFAFSSEKRFITLLKVLSNWYR